jgi:hypothetical protein
LSTPGLAFVGGGAAHLLSWAVIETIDFPGAMGMGDAGDFRRAASVEPAGRKETRHEWGTQLVLTTGAMTI